MKILTWIFVFTFASIASCILGCNQKSRAPTKPTTGQRRGNSPHAPQAPTAVKQRGQSQNTAALEAALREHVDALQAMSDISAKIAAEPFTGRHPLNQLNNLAQRARTSRQRIMSLYHPRRGVLSHTPTEEEAVMQRYSGKIRHLEQGIRFHLNNVATSLPNEADKYRAIIAQLDEGRGPGRPAQPNAAVAQHENAHHENTPQNNASPSPEQTPGNPPSAAAPKTETASGPPELTAEELWDLIEKREARKLERTGGGIVRVTGIVASYSPKSYITPLTLAAAEKGALQLRFGRRIDLTKIRPLQKITVEGKLSTIRGIDNLPSIEGITDLTIVSEEQTPTPPPLFLVYQDTDQLTSEGEGIQFWEKHRLIASFVRPVIVTGVVSGVEEFQNEFREVEKRITLKASSSAVVCRFGSAEEAEKVKVGDNVRLVGLWRNRDPSRPMNEVWLKDCWLYNR